MPSALRAAVLAAGALSGLSRGAGHPQDAPGGECAADGEPTEAPALLQVNRVGVAPARATTVAPEPTPCAKSKEQSLATHGRPGSAGRLAHEALLGVAQHAIGSPVVEARLRHALILGVVCSFLHVIAPDHLAILAVLSASAKPPRAFVIGATWGLGHCLGMVVVAAVVFLLGRFATRHMEQWETAGDYAIGISMIIIACYFAWNESAYVETHADGSCSLRQCEHDHEGGAMWRFLMRAPSQAAHFECALCCKQGPTGGAVTFAERLVCAECSSTVAPVEERPMPPGCREKAAVDERGAGVTMLGVFQGICCPRSLMGLSFMAELSPQGLVCFVVTFLAVSVLGRGLLAAAWASLTQLGFGTCVPVKVVYRASYVLTLLLGLVWIWATFSGLVDALEYTEGAAIVSLPAAA